jgi:hypothetical protein
MSPRLAVPLMAVLAAAGCKKSEAPRSKDIGQQTADVAADTALLRETSAAVNEVVRNATDCEAARAAIPPANAKLDEAERKVRTVTGRGTVDGLRQQVKRVQELCP